MTAVLHDPQWVHDVDEARHAVAWMHQHPDQPVPTPSAVEVIRAAAALLLESRNAGPSLSDAREAVRSAVEQRWSDPLEAGRLIGRVWALIEAKLPEPGWPYCRSAQGVALDFDRIADSYLRELAEAQGGAS
jgi:hypothetical protein